MIELHWLQVVLIVLMWIVTLVLAYTEGLRGVVDDYRDAVVKWGEAIESYKELHSEYKKLLEEYREIQSKIHMN